MEFCPFVNEPGLEVTFSLNFKVRLNFQCQRVANLTQQAPIINVFDGINNIPVT